MTHDPSRPWTALPGSAVPTLTLAQLVELRVHPEDLDYVEDFGGRFRADQVLRYLPARHPANRPLTQLLEAAWALHQAGAPMRTSQARQTRQEAEKEARRAVLLAEPVRRLSAQQLREEALAHWRAHAGVGSAPSSAPAQEPAQLEVFHQRLELNYVRHVLTRYDLATRTRVSPERYERLFVATCVSALLTYPELHGEALAQLGRRGLLSAETAQALAQAVRRAALPTLRLRQAN